MTAAPAAWPDDERWMREALAEAREAAGRGEVPVGAVVVRGGEIVGRGSNQPIARHDPTAHAEIMALRDAAARVGNYRLDDCSVYVTLEPCAMCAGALLHARVARVVWGASEPKTGAGGSVLDLFAEPQLNHHTCVAHGVLAEAASRQLADFFAQRRSEQRAAAHPLRDDALRTPESCLAPDAGSTWYSDLPALQGLRLHVWDSAAQQAPASPRTWLLLHGSPAHGALYRRLAPLLAAQGDRVLVPDWLGFGRSDKPKKEGVLTDARHLAVIEELLDRLGVARSHTVVAAHGDAARLALALQPERLWLINPALAASTACREWLAGMARKPQWDIAASLPADGALAEDFAQWQAQFPDKGYRAGLRAWVAAQARWLQAPAPAGAAQLLVSWPEHPQWWPAAPGALPPAARQHPVPGGDWLPLQSPAPLAHEALAYFDMPKP
ncbi:MAG: tRNA adenosine(34) deaminase TadA [Comamonas sp.]